MKRFVDILIALALLVLLWPLILLLALLVRLESPGNPFFAQTRLGRRERPFTIWKLRTMRTGTPHKGTHEIGADAQTRLGALLRGARLDELPQALNILVGQMDI